MKSRRILRREFGGIADFFSGGIVKGKIPERFSRLVAEGIPDRLAELFSEWTIGETVKIISKRLVVAVAMFKKKIKKNVSEGGFMFYGHAEGVS